MQTNEKYFIITLKNKIHMYKHTKIYTGSRSCKL